MKNTVRKHEFTGNLTLLASFSYSGLQALFDYFEELEEQLGEELEFDPIALRGEFADYGSFEEVKGDYPELRDLEDLHDQTTVIPHERGLIIQQF